MISIIHKLDNTILIFINNNMHVPITDKIMIFISSLGNWGMVWILISFFLIINKKYRKIGVMTFIALLLSTLLGEVLLKHLVHRMRPFTYVPAVKILIKKPLSYSFPSGHTASSFAAAGILVRYFKKYSIIILSLALLIAYSRLYLYVHYPSDVLAGIILGLACSEIINNLFYHKKSI